MAANIDILHLIPDLAVIGRAKLQVYCDEWSSRPIAREFGIDRIFVDDRLFFQINLDTKYADIVDEVAFIPIDELLGYMIDRHFEMR